MAHQKSWETLATCGWITNIPSLITAFQCNPAPYTFDRFATKQDTNGTSSSASALVGPSGPASPALIEHDIDLAGREPGSLDVEIKVHETLQLDRQRLLVPGRIERKLVVSQHIGSPLRCIEASEAHPPRSRDKGLQRTGFTQRPSTTKGISGSPRLT
jgi:hypothetical protein